MSPQNDCKKTKKLVVRLIHISGDTGISNHEIGEKWSNIIKLQCYNVNEQLAQTYWS